MVPCNDKSMYKLDTRDDGYAVLNSANVEIAKSKELSDAILVCVLLNFAEAPINIEALVDSVIKVLPESLLHEPEGITFK